MDTFSPGPVAFEKTATTALLLRIGTVVSITGLARSTIYRLVADAKFPPPVRLTKRAVGWRRIDVERWSDARQIAPY